MNSRALLRKPRGAQDSWFTPGSFLVHFWCTPGALLVHSRCTFGALLVHSRCTAKVSRKGIALLPKGSLDPPFRNVWIAFSLTYKPEREFAPLPKGSLDPPHRNVWIAFSPICKPERELRRFRKEVSILCTETLGSPFRQLANPKGNCPASERKPRSSAQKRLDRIL